MITQQKTLKKEISSGVYYTFIFKYANYAVQIIISAVLARILTPEEYGVVAIVNVFVLLFLMFSTVGLGTAIIQKLDIIDYEIFSLFIVSIFLGVVFSVIFFMSSGFISNFFNNNIYIGISKLLSISLFFNTINMVPYHLLLKAKKFKLLGISSVSIAIVTGILTIILALKGFSYYSLVYQGILQAIITFTVYLFFSKIKFYKSIELKIIKEVWNYSLFQFFYNILDFTSKNVDTLVIGKYLGATRLGFYDRAYRLLSTVNSLTYVVNPVLHPVLSQHQKNSQLIFAVLKKIFKILALLGLPLSIYLYFNASEIIKVLYGKQWVNSIPVFQFLSTSIWLMMLLSITPSFFQVLGKTKHLFVFSIFNLLLLTSSILIGIFLFDSLVVVAQLIAIAYLIIFLMTYYILVKMLFTSDLIEFFFLLKSSLLISVFLITISVLIEHFNPIINIYVSLLIKSIIFLVFYFFLLKLTGEWKEIISLFTKEKDDSSL